MWLVLAGSQPQNESRASLEWLFWAAGVQLSHQLDPSCRYWQAFFIHQLRPSLPPSQVLCERDQSRGKCLLHQRGRLRGDFCQLGHLFPLCLPWRGLDLPGRRAEGQWWYDSKQTSPSPAWHQAACFCHQPCFAITAALRTQQWHLCHQPCMAITAALRSQQWQRWSWESS